MLRITLIDAGSPRNECNEPLGIECLMGAIRKKLSQYVTLRSYFYELDEVPISKILKSSMPNLLGVSCSVGSLSKVTEIIQESFLHVNDDESKPIIVLGGTIPTFCYEQLINKWGDIICVVGEGEDALIGLCQSMLEFGMSDLQQLKHSKYFPAIPNIAYKINNELVVNHRQFYDLSSPCLPDRHFTSAIIGMNGIVRAEASRGCPWGKCTFCCIPYKYNCYSWRAYPVERIIKDLCEISNYFPQMVYFTDEDFLGCNYSRTNELSTQISLHKEKGLIGKDIRFFISTSVTSLLGKARKISDFELEILANLKNAGFDEIFIGIESGSATQLKRFGKGHTIEESLLIMSILNDLHFSLDIGFIMFDPEVTLKELKENVCFLKNKILAGIYSRLTKPIRILPKTQLYHNLADSKLVDRTPSDNEVMFKYKFQNPLVADIFEVFEKWESQNISTAYKLQNRFRGELPLHGNREQIKRELFRIRQKDLLFLESCIEKAEQSEVNLPERLDILFQKHLDKLNDYN